jgi:hypothetical protein
VNSPRFREHCTEGESESSHQEPSTSGADVRKGSNATQAAVKTQENDTQVSQNATDDDEVVQVGTRHFNVTLITELDVDNQETDGKNNAED